MTGPTLLITCLALIALGYVLQRLTDKTGWLVLALFFGTGILGLFVPEYHGFHVFNLFYMSLFFGLGTNLAYKRIEALKKKAQWEKLKTDRPQFTHCPHCRSALAEREIDGKKRLACTYCTYVHWNNPIPVAACVIPHKDGVVLVKRGVEPRKGYWALPAGFMEIGETPEQGACRESKEEANVDIEIDRPLFNFAPPKTPQVLMFFAAKPIDQTPAPGDDAEEARVFALDALPENMAFSSHVEAIKRWRAYSGR